MIERLIEVAAPERRRGGPSGLRLPVRERALRRGVPGRRASCSSGPPPEAIARMGDKTAARRAAVEAGVPIVPGTPEPVGSDAEARSRRAGPRLPGDDQGGPGGRREGDAGGRGAGGARVGAAARAIRGEPPRSATPPSTSRRRSSSRATSRSRSSPTPTARSCTWASASARSSGGTRSSSRSPRRPAVDGALRGEMGAAACRLLAGAGLPERRHRRVPRRRRPAILLPRGQHAPAGRASGHRAGDGDRPRPGAAPPRGRRGARLRPGGRRGARLGDRVPDLRRGSRRGIHPVPGPRLRRGARRPGPGCGWTRASTRAPRCRSTTIP